MPGRQQASSRPIAAWREQLRVAALAGELRRAPERLDRVDRTRPRGGSRRPSSRKTSGAVVAAELERGAQPRRGLVEGERGARGAGGEQVVLDRAVRRAERRGGREVVREVGERAARAAAARLERLADAQVQLGAARPGEPVVERAAHELVAEAPAAPVRRRPGRSSRLRMPRRAPRSSSASPSPAARRTTSSSTSVPAVAASSSRSVVRGASRASRWLTTSRTLSGLPSSHGARWTRIPSPASSTAPVSTARATARTSGRRSPP